MVHDPVVVNVPATLSKVESAGGGGNSALDITATVAQGLKRHLLDPAEPEQIHQEVCGDQLAQMATSRKQIGSDKTK